MICGLASGRIRAMADHEGNRISSAGPSTPVEVMGLNEVPPAGERFEVRRSEKVAKREAEQRRRARLAAGGDREAVTLDSLFGEIHRGNVQDMNIVLKVDFQGSLEPLVEALESLSVEEVNARVIHAAVGTVNESDVQLAVASSGVIIGFNVQPEPGARTARRPGAGGDPRVPDHLRHRARCGAGDHRHAQADLRGAQGRRDRGAGRSSGSAAATRSPVHTCARARSCAPTRLAWFATAR